MFHNDDEVIDFLEETREIVIPKEILKDREKTIETIEEHLEIEIPRKLKKKKKIDKYLEKINRDYVEFKKKKRPIRFARSLLFMSLYLLPLLVFFWFVTKNSNYEELRIWNPYVMIMIRIFSLLSILLSCLLGVSYTKRNPHKIKHGTVVLSTILVVYAMGVASLIGMLYGKDKTYQNRIIEEMMNTTSHQYVANLFYSNRVIENTLSMVGEQKNTEPLYEFEELEFESRNYANRYEEEILTKDPQNELYKIIKLEGTLRDGVSKYTGYLAVIYDPSHVKIGTSNGAGVVPETSFGQILSQISKNNQAVLAINAGGFYDPDWSSNGGVPHGAVIQDGQIKTEFDRGIDSGGIIGFTKDNQLILKRMSAQEAIDMGVRDAVDWGPFLIVNGKNYFEEERSKWACARTVIGQRKDGIVLMLVIDGGQEHSVGASYSDLADIMERYGAYNAANLDGGTSAAMVENNEYINIPFNGQRRTIRSLPNAWIVTAE